MFGVGFCEGLGFEGYVGVPEAVFSVFCRY